MNKFTIYTSVLLGALKVFETFENLIRIGKYESYYDHIAERWRVSSIFSDPWDFGFLNVTRKLDVFRLKRQVEEEAPSDKQLNSQRLVSQLSHLELSCNFFDCLKCSSFIPPLLQKRSQRNWAENFTTCRLSHNFYYFNLLNSTALIYRTFYSISSKQKIPILPINKLLNFYTFFFNTFICYFI